MKRFLVMLLVIGSMLGSSAAIAADRQESQSSFIVAQTLSVDEIASLAAAQSQSPEAMAVTAGEVDSNVAVLGMTIVAVGALLYISYN